MNEYMYRKELLDWSCEEADKIEDFFKKTQFNNLSGQDYKIDSIFKIKSNEALQNDDARTYRYLYHGTKEANVDEILRDGFLDAKTDMVAVDTAVHILQASAQLLAKLKEMF